MDKIAEEKETVEESFEPSKKTILDSKPGSEENTFYDRSSVSTVASFSSSAKSSAKSHRGSSKEVPEPQPETLPPDEYPYRVTLSVTVAVAYPRPTEEHTKMMDELVRKNKKTVEAPRPNHFLHCDYVIAPKRDSTLTDVVTYPVAAKIFTDNDSRVVKTWDDGRKLWVAWIHSHEVMITLKNVTALHNHVVDVTLCDSKEKMSQKARTDRPKAFRLPSATETKVPGRGVGGVVEKQSTSWTNMQPRDSIGGPLSRPKSKSLTIDSSPVQELDHMKKRELRAQSSVSRAASIFASEDDKKRISDLKRQQVKLQHNLKRAEVRTNVLVEDTEKTSKSEKKNKSESASRKSDVIHSKGKSVNIEVKLERLFAGNKAVTSRLTDRSGSLCDGFVTVAVDGDSIIPPQLVQTLNPLAITLKSVKDFPATPVSQMHLDQTCKPIFCKYDFLGQSSHVTESRPRGRHVYFEDTHVIFLGLLDEGVLREYIQSNSFHVEIHDRDRLDNHDFGESSLFGSEHTDHKLSNVGLVAAKRTSYNAFQYKHKAFDPFGVAKVSLLDILRGHTTIHTEVAVTSCPMPEVLHEASPKEGKEAFLVGFPGAVDRPERPPQLPGHYVQANTTLKLKISLQCPFVPKFVVPRLLALPKQMCLYSRVVYYFSYKNKDLLRRIEDVITAANASALGLDHFEKDVIDAALSTYKLSVEQKRDKTLDIITGFHVIDGNLHLMVLEGLREQAMMRLHELIHKSQLEDKGTLVHLFDSSMTFSNRLYTNLDVDLCRVRLHQTIPEIMSQPLLYVRDMVPKDCLECLLKCHQITQVKRLRDIAYSNLFPTAEMVIAMSREFGIPLTFEDFEDHHKIRPVATPKSLPAQGSYDTMTGPQPSCIGTTTVSNTVPAIQVVSKSTNLDNENKAFESLLQRRQNLPKKSDYITSNIVAVQEAGKRRRPFHPAVRTLQADAAAHNYSTQSLNTTEMAKNILRDMLNESDPNGRYAYHPQYNSAMVAPRHADYFYRKEDAESKRRWKTSNGFIYPGMKSSTASNQHPLKPDQSRIEDLKFSFKDNVLHRNIMAPILSRDRLKWDERDRDLNLYSQPLPDFGSPTPVTIHEAGDRKEMELEECRKHEANEWKKRVVVEDPLMRFHRVLWATEQSNKSNQPDKLTGLLKDEPKKYSLASRPAPVIPALSVVLNPSVDTAARARGAKLPPAFDQSTEDNVGFLPGPFDSRSWLVEENRIPIKDENHRLFAKKHGQDMNLYHVERTLLSQHIPAKPLTDEELRSHLFRIPPITALKEEERSDKSKTEPSEDVVQFGDGPRGCSEYRIKFPSYDVDGRMKEIYPRHTFDGFAALTKDGKSVTRDASIRLVPSDDPMTERSELEEKPSGGARPLPGTMLKDEASIEIVPLVPLPNVA